MNHPNRWTLEDGRWTLEDGRVIYLLTPERFHALVDGTKLICIDGEEVIKGKDYIDMDTRFGHLAFGVEAGQ
jgi:hypothetical protein